MTAASNPQSWHSRLSQLRQNRFQNCGVLLIGFGVRGDEKEIEGDPVRFMPTKANCFVKPFDQPIPRAATSATRFLPMLIVAGLLFQFPGPQPIQAAPARAVPAIAVSPGSVSLGPVQTQQFTTRTLGGLSIGGLITTNVTWSLSPVVGSISAAGLYTAPASISSSQTVTVAATSVADPTKSATATVTLNPPAGATVAPASVV